jgi:hypothetical protein
MHAIAMGNTKIFKRLYAPFLAVGLPMYAKNKIIEVEELYGMTF